MRSFVAILLLALFAFVAVQAASDTFVISYLETGQTVVADNDETFGPTTLESGAVNIVISASYPVEVCFQEGLVALGSLATSCNPEGYVPAVTSTVFAEENKYNQDGTGGAKKRLLRRALEDTTYTYNTTLYLRDGVTYGVTARWAVSDEDPSQNQTGSVSITANYNVCPAGQSGYGPNCATNPTPLTGTGATATVTPATPAVFSFNIDDTVFYTQVILTVHFSIPSGQQENHLKRRDTTGSPVQIYARRDAYPIITNTTSVFDASTSNSTSATTNTTSLTFTGPEQGNWLVLVNTAGNATYFVNVTLQSTACPSNTFPSLTNSSDCNPAIPILGYSYVPNNASSAIPANGTTFDFPAPSGGVTYFTYQTNWLLVGVVGASHGTSGAPGIFASSTGIPSADSYEIGSADAAQVNFLNVRGFGDEVIDWIVAVQPLEDSDSTGFQIFAGLGCANNCTSHGTCPPDDGADGYCTCDSGYKDFACSTQKLKTIYIVLIAIGGAIVLAIAIGVPVGCYLKNRKRARYERV